MQIQQNFPPSFLLLQQEGYLISSCLATGLTELRKANVNNQGAFYSSLFNLSVGLERLLKSIIIIDHMIKNNLVPPSEKELKNYGHNLEELYDKAVSISNEINEKIPERRELHKIDKEIMLLLSNFAKTTRYYNLNALSSQQKEVCPLINWNKIIMLIIHNDLTKKQREKIQRTTAAIADKIDDITLTMMFGLDKESLSTHSALELKELHKITAKFAVLRTFNILFPLKELIRSLSYYAYSYPNSIDSPPFFPQMHEFIEWIPPTDEFRSYVLRKQKWP